MIGLKSMKSKKAVRKVSGSRVKGSGKQGKAGELATRRSPEPAGRNACPTSAKRKRLVAILEEYGVSVVGFDGLRADAYEKDVAGQSLAELERFYGLLLGPARGYEGIISECPRWSEGSKNAGNPPHRTTLQDIKDRIMTDGLIRERYGSVNRLTADQSGPSEAEYLSAGVRTLGQELMRGKLDGKPVSENLRMFDRMLKMAGMRIKEQREAREEARFAWERGGREIEKKPEPPNPAYKAVRLNKAEREVLESLRVMCLTERQAWAQRQAKIRDRENGTERWFNPYA